MQRFVDPFGIPVYRSSTRSLLGKDEEALPWDEACRPPDMSEREASNVRGGFMAAGRGQDVVDKVEHELKGLGAKVLKPPVVCYTLLLYPWVGTIRD